MIDTISIHMNTTARRGTRPIILAVLGAIIGLVLAACGTSYEPGPVTDSTACGVVNADQAGGDNTDITNYLNSGPSVLDTTSAIGIEAQMNLDLQELPVLLRECAAHPSELASVAKSVAIDSPDTAVPTPTG